MLSDGHGAILRAFECPSGRRMHFGYLMDAETFYGRGHLAAGGPALQEIVECGPGFNLMVQAGLPDTPLGPDSAMSSSRKSPLIHLR